MPMPPAIITYRRSAAGSGRTVKLPLGSAAAIVWPALRCRARWPDTRPPGTCFTVIEGPAPGAHGERIAAPVGDAVDFDEQGQMLPGQVLERAAVRGLEKERRGRWGFADDPGDPKEPPLASPRGTTPAAARAPDLEGRLGPRRQADQRGPGGRKDARTGDAPLEIVLPSTLGRQVRRGIATSGWAIGFF